MAYDLYFRYSHSNFVHVRYVIMVTNGYTKVEQLSNIDDQKLKHNIQLNPHNEVTIMTEKNCHISQMTSSMRFNSYEGLYDRTRKI